MIQESAYSITALNRFHIFDTFRITATKQNTYNHNSYTLHENIVFKVHFCRISKNSVELWRNFCQSVIDFCKFVWCKNARIFLAINSLLLCQLVIIWHQVARFWMPKINFSCQKSNLWSLLLVSSLNFLWSATDEPEKIPHTHTTPFRILFKPFAACAIFFLYSMIYL